MADEEVKAFCHLIVGLNFRDDNPEKLIGFIIKNLREWSANFHMDMNGMIRIHFLHFPLETEIKSISIHKAFLQTAFVLGKWRPEIKEDETKTP